MVGDELGDNTEANIGPGLSRVPGHIQGLHEEVCQGVKDTGQRRGVAQLLNQYQDVFSHGEHDIGLTDLVLHQIPTLPGEGPVKEPPHRLGPEKEAEVQRQVEGLLKKGLIELAGGA